VKRLIVLSIQAVLVVLATIGLATTLLVGKLSVHAVSATKPAHVLKADTSLAEHYLDVMKRHLTRSDTTSLTDQNVATPVQNFLRARGLKLAQMAPDSQEDGSAWPESAETMIGLKRLDNLHRCIQDVLAQNVPGDLIECGAWRGGATIFMRAALFAYNDPSRRVWVADSFQGLPAPTPGTYPADLGDEFHKFGELAVPVDAVRMNFARYGLLDDRVKFLVGWFKDTLAKAPIERLAVLRVDADMYEGTIQSLEALYSKVSPGGYIIIDDYGAVQGCRKAVDTFRREQHISEPLQKIDWTGVYWQKAGLPTPAANGR
jgi:O-methyltransferase